MGSDGGQPWAECELADVPGGSVVIPKWNLWQPHVLGDRRTLGQGVSAETNLHEQFTRVREERESR